ncbi:MAG: hypothetical protein QME41_09045 [Actinomycetota bacterium]|nr:hypothetical protein [Actinomycetota bacterium]
MKMFKCCQKEKKFHSSMLGLGLMGLFLGAIAAIVLAVHKSKLSSDDNKPNLLYIPIK